MKKLIKRISVLFAGCAAFLMPLEAFAASDDQTMREKMSFAAQNTVIGIVTVFCMLILIMLVIYLFRFLPKLVGFFTGKNKSDREEEKKEEKVNAQSPPPVNEQAASPPGTGQAAPDLTDDAELVAVITAAIAAARAEEEQTPVGSFVVRTIRKRA